MKNIKLLMDVANELYNNHINNTGTLDYSEKQYGYLNQDLDHVEVGFFKTPFSELDSDYSEDLRSKNYTIDEDEAIQMLTHRINTINEELTGNKKLKVGDVIYMEYAMSDQLSPPITIERITKTQAISGNFKFKIDDKYNITTIGGGSGYSRPHFYLENDMIKRKYLRQRNVRFLKTYDWNKLKDDGELNDIVRKLIDYDKNLISL